MYTDLQEASDLSGQFINGFKLKQDKLSEFLEVTEQECLDGSFTRYTVIAIEELNFINKAVLKWRYRATAEHAVDKMRTFFKNAHKVE